MIYKNIEYDISESIAQISLNRPDVGNTLNLELAKELYDATNRSFTNKKLKALILTGKGKLFCGGGDLKFLLANKKEVKKTLSEMVHYFHGAISRMARMEIPVIIGINGTAGGGGFSLAITGDIIFSIKDAKFTLAYTNAGLSPDGSSTYYLPRMVGIKRAKELMLTNRVFTAYEALEMGLIDKVLDTQEELTKELRIQAETFANGPRKAYANVKKLLSLTYTNGLETQMELEGLKIADSAESSDGQEGLAAFSEKRKPIFDE